METKHVVLIVDDTPENLRVLGDMLEQDGYDVLVANSGLEGLNNAMSPPPPDIILLDILMPEMNGYEVCRRLKASSVTRDIPVIFISALDLPEQKVQAFREGAVDYVTKPFQAEEVLARVHTHILLAHTDELRNEIEKRKIAEEKLLTFTMTLEDMVAERTAQLREANECLDAFSSSISHDLRAPLSNLSGLCDILSDKYAEKLDAEGVELVEYILKSVQIMSDRIQALLKFSRLNRGAVSRVQVDLSSMARKILDDYARSEPERNVTCRIQDNIGAQADPCLMVEVMENLLGNAWKYTSKSGNPYIEFGVEECSGERILFVSDNGVGFDMSQADKLFRMFQRMHNNTEFVGDGIGLATVKRIINRHGGRIWVESEPGKGATFRFTLPGAD